MLHRFCFYNDGIADQMNGEHDLLLGSGFSDLVESMNNIATKGVQYDDVTAMCIEIINLNNAVKLPTK